jgi:hypothetical protein
LSLVERARTLLLGDRLTPPAELREAIPEGVTLRQGRLIPRIGGLLGRMGGSAAAVTLRRTIVVSPDVPLTSSLLAHELAHVRQWKQDPFFPVRYTVATLRHGYRNNPYEVEARVASVSPPHTPRIEDLT